jgi:ABC-2 type transport system ATP-binding protein
VAEFIGANSDRAVRVRTPEGVRLHELVAARGARVRPGDDQTLLISGLSLDVIGDLAFDNGVRLHELAPMQASLEAAFMELTRDSIEFEAVAPIRTETR